MVSIISVFRWRRDEEWNSKDTDWGKSLGSHQARVCSAPDHSITQLVWTVRGMHRGITLMFSVNKLKYICRRLAVALLHQAFERQCYWLRGFAFQAPMYSCLCSCSFCLIVPHTSGGGCVARLGSQTVRKLITLKSLAAALPPRYFPTDSQIKRPVQIIRVFQSSAACPRLITPGIQQAILVALNYVLWDWPGIFQTWKKVESFKVARKKQLLCPEMDESMNEGSQ